MFMDRYESCCFHLREFSEMFSWFVFEFNFDAKVVE